MRRLRPLALAALAVLASVLVTGAAAHGEALHLVRVAHFSAPVYATAAPGEPGNLYVVEQAGRILVLQNGRTRSTPFLDIRSQVRSGGEQGLLSVAFAPDYAKSRRFYVDYTDTNGDTRVVQYRSNGKTAVTSSAKQLLFVKDFAPNHNGGQLQFGPDGRLYWGNGDGGGGGDPQHNGQNLARPFAKIMRLNVDVAKPRWQLVAYGLRNPWRFSFDRATGDLYIGDVGQGDWEEIDYLRKGSGIANFGWNRYEGTHSYDASTQLLTRGGYRGPIAEYSHSEGCSVTGGYVYRGTKIPSIKGRYFYGDYCSGNVWSLKVSAGKARGVRLESIKVPGLSSFGQDAAGELYATSLESGDLFRLAG
jgi:glucose/arabinose dehydrogenase